MHFTRRALIALVAVMVLLISTVVYAADHDLDIAMADQLGLTSAMPQLAGGYVSINESQTIDNLTFTVAQSIGDRNTQWIQIDSNLPWSLQNGGYYMADMNLYVYGKTSLPVDGGTLIYSYNNQGMVSFMICAENYEHINRSQLELTITDLRAYTSPEDDYEAGVILSDATFHFQWTNRYQANSIHHIPLSLIQIRESDGSYSTAIITGIDITPVSLRLTAIKDPRNGSKSYSSMDITSITMKDKSVITFSQSSSGGERNNTFLDSYISFEELGVINPDDVSYITVCGKDIIL